MSQVVRTQLSCPGCGHVFPAIIEQVIDVGSDPQAKARFLSGRVNAIPCPNCGHTVTVATPLLYHDPTKELLVMHVPMGLNISQQERESLIGGMTRSLIDNIPQGQRKGYLLLQPRQALTIPGMIDMILEADGITAEMREAQREKMRVMEMFLQVGPDGWPRLVEEQGQYLDEEFIQMILVTAQNAAETGKGPMAEALMILYNWMIQHTPVGQAALEAAAAQEAVVQEVAGELEAIGEQITREGFMELVLGYAGDDDRVQAVVGLMRPALDYAFFQTLSERINAATGEEKTRLETLRSRLLELTQQLDEQTQAVIQRAADTLRVIATSADIDAAIWPRLDQIDDTFLAVLQANIHAAEQNHDPQTGARLKLVLERVLAILQESAPPPIKLIQAILSTENDADAHAILEERAPQFGPDLLEIMDAVAQDLDTNNPPAAQRLRALRTFAAGHIGTGEQQHDHGHHHDHDHGAAED
ncbi:MAG: CpXC domain-containing protein [Anaerolineae bacterium]|nr:CpXC domain-containing protein [Anaerolineae bacterium]